MTIATIAEVKCLIQEALALESDKYLASVRQFNATTGAIPLVMSDGTVLNLDMSAVIAAAGGIQKDVHVIAWGDYDKATNTGYLTMSNGSKVPVDMTQVIADAIASIVFPDIPEGFDCAAIGELPTRPYVSGDSILVHGVDGTCARVIAKPGVFSDVRVDTITKNSSVYTGKSTEIVTTVQNLADGLADVQLFITVPQGDGCTIDTPTIYNVSNLQVQALPNYTYKISNIGRGQRVSITLPVTFTKAGSYGFSSSISIAADNAFDWSTTDDRSSANVNVADVSTGTTSADCPLIHVFAPDGVTELPVRPGSEQTFVGYNKFTSVIITPDDEPVRLKVTEATTAVAHTLTDSYLPTYTYDTNTIYGVTLFNDKVAMFQNYGSSTLNYSDPLGITLDVAAHELLIPPPPAGKRAISLVELAVGPTCNRQHLRLAIIRESDLKNMPGIDVISPDNADVTIEYTKEGTRDNDTIAVGKDGILGWATYNIHLKTAKLTISKHTAYTGVATLSLTRVTQASTGNVKLIGTGDTIAINIASTSTSLDTISKFAKLLSVVVTD